MRQGERHAEDNMEQYGRKGTERMWTEEGGCTAQNNTENTVVEAN